MRALIEDWPGNKEVDLIPALCKTFGDFKYYDPFNKRFFYVKNNQIIRFIVNLSDDCFEL